MKFTFLFVFVLISFSCGSSIEKLDNVSPTTETTYFDIEKSLSSFMQMNQNDFSNQIVVYYDKKKYLFLFDTGSQRTYLFSSFFKKSNIPLESFEKAEETLYHSILDEITLDTIMVKNVSVYFDSATPTNPVYDGVIGMDFFKVLKDFTIDFRSQKIYFEPEIGVDNISTIANFHENRIFIPVKIADQIHIALIDSGFSYSAIDQNAFVESEWIEEGIVKQWSKDGISSLSLKRSIINSLSINDSPPLEIKLYGLDHEYFKQFYMYPSNQHFDIILGADFLDNYKLTFLPSEMKCIIEY